MLIHVVRAVGKLAPGSRSGNCMCRYRVASRRLATNAEQSAQVSRPQPQPIRSPRPMAVSWIDERGDLSIAAAAAAAADIAALINDGHAEVWRYH